MLKLHPIPNRKDNYIWLISDDRERSVYVIDPGDAGPVKAYLTTHNRSIAAIIITHSHNDHIGGISELLSWQDVPVIGPKCARIVQITQVVDPQSRLTLWNRYPVQVISSPGHLPEHLCYLFSSENTPHLLCGDVLFSAGCGRAFGGTFTELKASLDAFKRLPRHTRIYCAHEYTLANLAFAQVLEPNNADITAHQDKVQTLRQQGLASLPSTLELELKINPFLRCDKAEVIAAASAYTKQPLNNELDVFQTIRSWKDSF